MRRIRSLLCPPAVGLAVLAGCGGDDTNDDAARDPGPPEAQSRATEPEVETIATGLNRDGRGSPGERDDRLLRMTPPAA